jgi:hypothetical protein
MFAILTILFILLLVYYIYLISYPKTEPFINYISNENVVIQVYQDILQRLPSQKELVRQTRGLNDGMLTECILRQQLIDSDEYSRAMKIQSNTLRPELERIISDRKLLGQLATLYKNTRGKSLPPKMGLPLKDIFIYLNYNIPALTEVLKDPAYAYFETDVTNALLDKEDMLQLFDETFPSIRAKRDTYKPTDSCPGIGDNNGPGKTIVLPTPSFPDSTKDKSLGNASTLRDSSSLDPQLQAILANALDEFNKDKAAQKCSSASCAPTTCATQPTVRLYEPTHKGDMVLRPEYAWSVPTQRTPVCTTLGLKQHLEPVVLNSTLMNGTNLEEAATGTSVGSIMPKFDYRNYVELPLKK